MPKVYSSFSSKNSASSKEKNYYKKPIFKKPLFYIIVVIVLAIIGFVLWSILKSPEETKPEIVTDTEQQAPEQVAVINYLKGESQYQEQNEEEWNNLSFTKKIAPGTSIRTLDESRLELIFPEGSILRLAENSGIIITEISPADIVIEQVAGKAYHRVNNEGTAIYKVIANEDEITALGTAFNTEVRTKTATTDLESITTRVAVIESSVRVKVFQDEQLINMQTVEEGNEVEIDKSKEEEEVIEESEIDKETLLEDDWMSWNKTKDENQNFTLGIFADEIKLEITAPSDLDAKTDKDSYTIKGKTEQKATVTIDGDDVDNKDGLFEHAVKLAKGENKFEIIAELDNKQTKKTVTIDFSEEDSAQLTLSASVVDTDDVKLSWQVSDGDSENGFKIVRAKTANPSYPGSDYKYITQGNARAYTWRDLAEGTHHFRVCMFTNANKCDEYSNDVSVTIKKEEEPEDKQGSISLQGQSDDGSAKLSWTANNMGEFDGFKIVYSSSSNPVYPGDTYKYLSNTSSSSYTWSNLSKGTYHFRVCKYKGGKCELYSNDITIIIEKTDEPVIEGSISLAGSVSDSSVSLSWTTSNLDAPKGFKLVKSTSPNPVYPGNDYKYLSDPAVRSYTWSGLSAGTYHFRVCQYLGGKCGIYSNNITLTVEQAVADNGSITLSGSSSEGKVFLSWTTSGSVNLENGYKVIMSENPNPVYPGNQYHYISRSNRSDSWTWTGLEMGQTYHFRVCQYIGGACGIYSNDIAVTIQ